MFLVTFNPSPEPIQPTHDMNQAIQNIERAPYVVWSAHFCGIFFLPLPDPLHLLAPLCTCSVWSFTLETAVTSMWARTLVEFTTSLAMVGDPYHDTTLQILKMKVHWFCVYTCLVEDKGVLNACTWPQLVVVLVDWIYVRYFNTCKWNPGAYVHLHDIVRVLCHDTCVFPCEPVGLLMSFHRCSLWCSLPEFLSPTTRSLPGWLFWRLPQTIPH